MSNEPIFYVYVYLDPRKPGKYVYGEYKFEYEPFYVGKGCYDRSHEHLYEYNLKNNGNKSFTNKIKKIQRKCNNNPVIPLYKSQLEEKYAFDLEISMIATIGRKDLKRGPLCNLTDGGDGSSGRLVSEETREKFRNISPESRKRISEANKGKKRSDEAKLNMSKAQKGHISQTKGKTGIYTKETLEKMSNSAKNKPPMSEETKKKIGEGGKGRTPSEETRKKLSDCKRKYSNEIICKSIELRKLGISWHNISKILKIPKTNIRRWCMKDQNNAEY